MTLYYDLNFTSVEFYLSDNPGNTFPGMTNPPSGAGGTVGDHFATAIIPYDGSDMICATATATTAGGAGDMAFFSNIPIENPDYCNATIFATAIDNEILGSAALGAECEAGTFDIVPTGDATDLIDIIVEFSISEVEEGDDRVITYMFEACGVVLEDDMFDPEPATGDNGFAIVSFTIEDVPADCTELNYEFCSPPGGQSFGIGGFTAEIQCVPICIASNDGPACVGEPVQLFGEDYCGATYSWTGPNGFMSTDQNPSLGPTSLADAGIYTLIVTSMDGITQECTTTVVVNENPEVTVVPTDVLCNGDANGIATANATGAAPFDYAWSDGQSTMAATGLAPGTYMVTVLDANGCEVIGQTTIDEPPVLTCSVIGVDILCNGDATGSADATIVGGTAPYSFAWSNGASTEDISTIPAGTYTLLVTDDNECTTMCDVTIVEPPVLTCSIVGVDVLCNGEATGSADATIIGGTAPYTFAWSNGAATEDLTGVPAGDYTLNVTDANGCTTMCDVTIVEPPVLACTIVGLNTGCMETVGSADATVLGGTAPYTYAWSTGETTEDITSLPPGEYTLTVTDNNGCTTTCDVTISETGCFFI